MGSTLKGKNLLLVEMNRQPFQNEINSQRKEFAPSGENSFLPALTFSFRVYLLLRRAENLLLRRAEKIKRQICLP